MDDKVKVDQIANILIRYNKLDAEIMEKLCFVIPRIDSWDFAALRDGRKELRHLRSKILGIPNEWNVNMADIDSKVSEVERQIAMDNPKYAKLLEEKNAVSLIPFLKGNEGTAGNGHKAASQEQYEPISLLKLKTMIPNSGILKDRAQLYKVSRSLSKGQLEIQPVTDGKESARELFLKHMDELDAAEKVDKRIEKLSHRRFERTPN